MYTDANYPTPRRAPTCSTASIGELRIAVVLFFVLVGLPARAAVDQRAGRRRSAATPCAASPASRPPTGRRCSGSFAAAARHRPRPRHRAARPAEVHVLRRQRVPGDAQPARPADVVAAHRGLLLRRAAADRARAAARRAAAARLRRADRRRPRRGRPSARCTHWPPEATWTLPTYLGAFACGHRRRGARHEAQTAAALVLARRDASRSCSPTPCWHSGGDRRARPRGRRPARRARLRRDHLGARRAARPACSRSPPLRALGTLSFGIYLWHMPVLYALQLHERFPERFVPAIALGAAAHVRCSRRPSWYLIEKPAIALSGRALARAQRRAAGREARRC